MLSSRRRRYRCIQIAILVAAMVSPAIYAQTVTATLSGTVADVQGAMIGDATVTVTDTATGAVRTIQTDSGGRYSAKALQPGPYKVSVTMSGFASKDVSGVTLNVGDVKDLPVILSIGSAGETVNVSAEESSIQTETSSNGELIDNKQVVELPLANRQFYNLALLSPAAYQPAQNSTLGFRGGINIAGATEISNEFTVNGVYNNDMGVAQPSFRPSVETIQEFKLLTGVYPAEFGQMSGGHLIIITKSGTNAFHGSAYEFIRNQVTDAKNYFTQVGVKTPSFKQNTFGGTIGGPILKDKLFFFFGYEGQRIRQAVTALAVVPTTAQLQGTVTMPGISPTGVLSPLYNPNTGVALTPTTGTVATGATYNLPALLATGQINWSSVAAQAGQTIANLGFPAPTNTSANNYNFNEIRSENMNEYNGRIDYHMSSKDSINGSYSAFIDPAFEPSNSLCSSLVLPNFGCFTNQISTLINASYDRIITPNMVNSLTLGYQRLQQPRVTQDNTSIGSKYAGLPGGPYFTQAGYANNNGLPSVSISGYSAIGGATNLPQNRWDSHYQIADSLTWTHGAHTVKGGIDFLLARAINLITSDGRGQFTVNDASISGLSGGGHLGSTGDSLADFLLGLTYSSTIGPTATKVYMNYQSQDFFLQDDWKVKSNLTLNLGLRYELDHPVYTPNATLSNFNLQSQTYVVAGKNGTSNGLYNLDKNNFAPRVGFSYSPFHDDKTIVKGAAGMFYNSPLLYNQFLTNGTQAPFRFVSTYTSVASVPASAGPPPTAPVINTIQLNQPFTIPNTGAPIPCTTGAQTVGGAGGCVPSLAGLNINQNYATPYLTEWSLGVEQALSRSTTFETTYFGSKGTRLPLSIPLNVVNLATYTSTTAAPSQGSRPFPNFSGVTEQATIGNSEFHSWQNSIKQSYSHGVSFLLAYTWGKSIDGGGGIGSSSQSSGGVQNVYNLRADRGLSDFDVRHRLIFSPVAELPFGKGKAWLNHGVESTVFGGFQVSGIFSWQTGRPFTITDSATNNSGSFEAADRPNLVVGQDPNNGPKTVAKWFNTAAFAVAPAFKVTPGVGGAPNVVTQRGQFGNAGRNIVEGPAYTDLDLTLARQFAIFENIHGQIRAESFNLLNHANFFNPLSTGQQIGTTSFGQITQANTPRQFQFSLRILF
jgi:hypothetical protein